MLALARYRWWFATVAALAILLTAMGRVGALGPLQNAAGFLATPLERGFDALFRPVAEVLSNLGELRELQQENQRLRNEVESLRAQVSELQQSNSRLQELEAALGIVQEGTAQELLAANVLARDVTALSHVIVIDRGAADGLREGMPVLSAQGSLVGRVTTVLPQRSFVRLINDARSVVAARIQESGIDASLHGTADRGLELRLVQGQVNVGETVITSGLGGAFPPGIPIGKVIEVRGTPQDAFRTVRVEPLARLGTMQTVLVLRSFVPQPIESR